MSTTIDVTNTAVFERRKSPIHFYCPSADAIFNTASGGIMRDPDGPEYIDFLSGAGSLNDGHNALHRIAAGRYHRIPAGPDARGIASSDARQVGRAGRLTSRSAREAYRRAHPSGGSPRIPGA
jgi:hypothetical protein